jgi:NhaP-type Na+/H+ or K+/H+ antiporter
MGYGHKHKGKSEELEQPVNELNIALAVIGVVLLTLGMFSSAISRISLLTEPLIALLAGVLVGPAVFNLVDIAAWGNQETFLQQAALLTLGIALMGTALRLPVGYVRHYWQPLVVLLGLGMPLVWLCGSLLTYFILGPPFLIAVLIAAIITPTDPVVAGLVVTGDVAEENLPERLRHTISGESAFNDGLAYPFVLLPILLLTRPPSDAVSHWLLYTVLLQVGVAAALGLLLGYGTGKVLQWARGRETTEPTSILAVALALTLSVLGIVETLGLDSVLAVFLAGLAFNATLSSKPRESSDILERKGQVQEVAARFFDLPIFVLLGMALPWEGWWELGWLGLVLAIVVVPLRRVPVVLALKPLLGQMRRKGDVLFLSWFGPLGAAALYYTTLALQEVEAQQVWVVGSLIICASLIAHGVTAAPFARLYGR